MINISLGPAKESIPVNPKKILAGIENAGAIFLGKWTPEAVGDYLAGPNHTLSLIHI